MVCYGDSVEHFKLCENNNSLKCIVGIKNIGNTCYINTALQCLSNIYELSKYFLTDMFKKHINSHNILGSKGVIAYHFAKIAKLLHFGKEKSISILNFRKAIGKLNPIFSGNTQEDSEEFLIFLLDMLHEDLNRVKFLPNSQLPKIEGKAIQEASEISLLHYLSRNQSIIVDLFVGQFKSSVRCLKCKNINYKFDAFMCLSLPVPTYNLIELTIYFVYFDISKGILQVILVIDSDSSILDLRKQISGIVNVHPMSFLIASMESNTIEKIHNLLASVSGLVDDVIFCYQIDPSLFNSDDNRFSPKIRCLSSEKKILSDSDTFCNSTCIEGEDGSNNLNRLHIGEFNTAMHEIYYSQVDHNYVEHYNPFTNISKCENGDNTFIKVMQNMENTLNNSRENVNGSISNVSKSRENNYSSSNNSPILRNEIRRLLLATLGSSLMVYTDENYGFKEDYLKVPVRFRAYSWKDVGNPLENRFYKYKRTEIAFQRIVYLNLRWSINKMISYLTESFMTNEEDMRPDIRVVNVNKNKFGQSCYICKRADCCDCVIVEELGGKDSTFTLADVISLFPKNEMNNMKVDNNYLYLDASQRKITVPRCDFELELTYISKNPPILTKTFTMTRTLRQQSAQMLRTSQSKLTIYDCLNKFYQKDILDEHNEWHCSKCQKNQKATNKIEVWRAPAILIIQLKRFKGINNNQKIDKFVDFPIKNLDMNRYVLNQDKKISYKYDLMSIINHSGSLGFGHYTAFCKNYSNKKWYKYDDLIVTEVTDEKLLVSNSAYVLFYRRKDLTESGVLDEIYAREYQSIEEITQQNGNECCVLHTVPDNSNREKVEQNLQHKFDSI